MSVANTVDPLKRALALLALVFAAIFILSRMPDDDMGRATADAVARKQDAKKETYRLVHAIGNTERVNATGLSKSECEMRRDGAKIVAVSIGAGGSITCLPESLFSN